VIDSDQTFRDLSFQTSLAWNTASGFGLFGIVSKGFRAPNLNDLGALGLNDLGFEIPAADAIPAGALLSTSAGEDALSTGKPLRQLNAERLFNYEAGIRFRSSRRYLRVQVFDTELYDPIVRRTLLFPASAVPAQLGGLAVTPIAQTAAQRQQGVATVATSIDPRAVKAFVNDGRSRYTGVEALAEFALASRWKWRSGYSFLAGRDLNPNRNIRRLPPQQGFAALQHTNRRWWSEFRITATGAQERLSGGDRDDERIGASRSRNDIASFFRGSRVAPHLNNGIFAPTGETLEQIQNRVLPGVAPATRVPLYTETAGWFRADWSAGYSLTEALSLNAGVWNIFDRNYRYHGSGVDGPGIDAFLSVFWRF
jgi:outer membrane receptor protein involved in Fe transport